jgi:DNA-binding CsgD family transcriptional regulator
MTTETPDTQVQSANAPHDMAGEHGSPFTRREIEILGEIAHGASCDEIARVLAISEFTVRKHRANMLAKRCLRNAAELVADARRRGWLESPPGHPASISLRESDVMALVVAGRTSKEIARQLNISHLTVRKHRENLLRKCGVASTAQLVALRPASAASGAGRN